MIPKRVNKTNNQIFHKILIEILIAKINGQNDVSDVAQFYGKPPTYGSTYDPKDLIIAETEIEPELYIQAQEICHQMTGRYWPMAELLHFLTAYFIKLHKKNSGKCLPPFILKRKGARYSNLIRFHRRMSRYYHTIEDFM